MHTHTEKDISCYSSALLVEKALEDRLTDGALFDGIEDYRPALVNSLEWVPSRIWNRLAANIEQHYPDEEKPLFRIGEEITISKANSFQLLFLKIAPLALLSRGLNRHFESVCKNISANLTQRPNGATVVFTPIDKSKYSTQICDFNMGCSHALLQQKGYKGLRVAETGCAARGDSCSCILEFTWDPAPPLVEKLKTWFFFRIRSEKQIIEHIQTSNQRLQSQHKELKSLQEFHTHIMCSMDESIVWLDQNAKITFCNLSFQRLTGADESAALGHGLLDLDTITIPDKDTVLDQCHSQPGTILQREVIVAVKGRKKRIGEATFTWVAAGEREPGYLVVIRDVTHAREVERKLSFAEDRYRSLYERSPAAVVGMDLDGKIVYANPAMLKLTGFSEADLRLRTFRELIAADASEEEYRPVFEARLNDADSRLQEVHIKTCADEWRVVAMSTYPLRDETGDVVGLSGIGVDVTETKRLNEQIVKTQRMELLGQLAGGLAHDFNNIMCAVTGTSQLIERGSADLNSRRQAANVLSAASRASDLVKKLLSFSRGEETTVRVPCSINQILHESEALVGAAIDKRLQVRFVVPEKEYLVSADTSNMCQCIINLCVNARDALTISKTKEPRILVRLEDGEKQGWLRISVEDNGPGIPPHILERIFDPFFTTKKDHGGTGLGLSVVYGIVKTHNGDVSVESRPGQGATFYIDLPLLSHAAVRKPGTGVVMVVDDDPTIRAFCVQVLKHYGYAHEEFDSMHKAIAWMGGHATDTWCAISDVYMPDMEPKAFSTACRVIRDDMRVVWISGATQALPQGAHQADLLLPKPFSPISLVKTIEKIPLMAG